MVQPEKQITFHDGIQTSMMEVDYRTSFFSHFLPPKKRETTTLEGNSVDSAAACEFFKKKIYIYIYIYIYIHIYICIYGCFQK